MGIYGRCPEILVPPTSMDVRCCLMFHLTRIPQMDRGNTTEGLECPGENVNSYFHPPFGYAFSGLPFASP